MQCCRINPQLLTRFTSSVRRSRRQYNLPAANEISLKSQQEEIATNKNKFDDSGVEYPPILDLSRVGRKRREREEWHNKVKLLGTVEEKIFELNMPKYYGWRSSIITEGSLAYDPLPHAQYITRTHLSNQPMPECYNNIISSEMLDSLVKPIKDQVEEALIVEFSKKRDHQGTKDELEDKKFVENLIAKGVSEQVNRILMTNLTPHYPHLLESQVDVDPRIEAFWFFGGFEVPYEVVRARSGHYAKEWIDEPVNQTIQYKGSPILQLRHNLPLKEIVSIKESEDLPVPVESFDPRKIGYYSDRLRATIIPGFWPGDYSEFGIVSYLNRGHLHDRPKRYNDELDALKSQAIFGSFSWLYAQACYQGFSTFQDPTYPLVNQMIITNGQWWSFSVYQLNTTTMHIDSINENPKRNICWTTDPIKLFDTIEDGKVHGLNDEVLQHLIKFYANVPEVREGVDMKPYLTDEKIIAGIEEPERRKWLEDKYKHLMSNRPRHRLAPEIHHWEKIYKINSGNTKPIDKRREPWEFGINVYSRRLDDHTPEYIPKCYRVHPKSKAKWVKNYYPCVRRNDIDS